jgi:hypothetical protein
MLLDVGRWMCECKIFYANHHALDKYFFAYWLQKDLPHLHMSTY